MWYMIRWYLVGLRSRAQELDQSVSRFALDVFFSPELLQCRGNGYKASGMGQSRESFAIVEAEIRQCSASISLHLGVIGVSGHAGNLAVISKQRLCEKKFKFRRCRRVLQFLPQQIRFAAQFTHQPSMM
jgi:hypothetical protein